MSVFTPPALILVLVYSYTSLKGHPQFISSATLAGACFFGAATGIEATIAQSSVMMLCATVLNTWLAARNAGRAVDEFKEYRVQ